MSPQAQKVVAALKNAGNKMVYADLLEATDFKDRALLPRVRKELKALGIMQDSITLEDGKPVHHWTLVEGN